MLNLIIKIIFSLHTVFLMISLKGLDIECLPLQPRVPLMWTFKVKLLGSAKTEAFVFQISELQMKFQTH